MKFEVVVYNLLEGDEIPKPYSYQFRTLGYLPSDSGDHEEQMTQMMMFVEKLVTEGSQHSREDPLALRDTDNFTKRGFFGWANWTPS